MKKHVNFFILLTAGMLLFSSLCFAETSTEDTSTIVAEVNGIPIYSYEYNVNKSVKAFFLKPYSSIMVPLPESVYLDNLINLKISDILFDEYQLTLSDSDQRLIENYKSGFDLIRALVQSPNKDERESATAALNSYNLFLDICGVFHDIYEEYGESVLQSSLKRKVLIKEKFNNHPEELDQYIQSHRGQFHIVVYL